MRSLWGNGLCYALRMIWLIAILRAVAGLFVSTFFSAIAVFSFSDSALQTVLFTQSSILVPIGIVASNVLVIYAVARLLDRRGRSTATRDAVAVAAVAAAAFVPFFSIILTTPFSAGV